MFSKKSQNLYDPLVIQITTAHTILGVVSLFVPVNQAGSDKLNGYTLSSD